MKAIFFLAAALTATGCVSVRLSGDPQPVRSFSLDALPTVTRPAMPLAASLVVTPTRAAPGFDTPRMAYTRRAHEIEYYARHRWVDRPASMIAPQLRRAIERSGAYTAVVEAPSAADAGYRLDTELLALVQDFSAPPSRVRLVLHAQLFDLKARVVVAAKEFSVEEPAASEDAPGGAAAANRALARVLEDVVGFASGGGKK